VEPIPLSFDKQYPAGSGSVADTDGDKTVVGEDEKDTSTAPSESGRTDASTVVEEKTVSVSHVLTNVIVLQSFLFELASLVQVRAGVFDEVRFA
jgi:hypothetical protein